MHTNAKIDIMVFLFLFISVLTRYGIILSDFLNSNDVISGTLWVKKCEKFKNGCITCKLIPLRPEEMLQAIFVYIFAM